VSFWTGAMLVRFRVANHRSIREEQALVFGPDRPVVAVYGANASGKSNLLDALRWMHAAVCPDDGPGDGPGDGRGASAGGTAGDAAGGRAPRVPFRLDPLAAGEPSLFATDLLLDGVRYDYGFVVDDARVRMEWLHAYPRGRKRVVFDRAGDRVRLGSTLPEHRARTAVLRRLVGDSALALTVAAGAGQAEVLPVYRWFRSGLRIGGADDRRVVAVLTSGARARGAVVALLRAADLGVTDLVVDPLDTAADVDARLREARRAADEAGAALTVARAAVDRVVAAAPHPAPETRDALAGAMWVYEERSVELRGAEQQVAALEAVRARARGAAPTVLLHQGRRGATLGLAEQSTGTRRWLSLVAGAVSALDEGGLLAVDEADTSVHPALTARLIGLFRDADANPRGGQLLFTTHHERLLDEDTLSRDEVWFVEKDTDTGESRLFPLAPATVDKEHP
jgi:hypothetical protein